MSTGEGLSTVFEGKKALFDLLTEALPDIEETADVPVVWGAGGGDEQVLIWTGESDLDFATIGGQVPSLDDDFRVEIVVEAMAASGRELMPAEERMWEIADAVGTVLREANDLIGPRCLFSRPSRVKQEYFQTDKRQGSRARITLAGKARI